MNNEDAGWHKHAGEGPEYFSNKQVKDHFEKVFLSSLASEEKLRGRPMDDEEKSEFRREAWKIYLEEINPYKK